MTFRWTLIHPILGSHVITEPGGWKNHKKKMVRHPEFFSLVESLEAQLTFYGRNDTEGVDGGIDFINQVESTYGLDENLRLFIELAEDDVTYADYFDGLLSIAALQRFPDNTAAIPVLQNNLWAKFLNRWETPVSMSDLFNLDGVAVDPAVPITTRLTPQLIQKRYSGRYQYAYELGQPEDNGFEYAQIDFELESLNELGESKRMLPRILTNIIEDMFVFTEAGNYEFDIKITLGHSRSIDANFSYSTLGKYVVWFQKNEDTPIALVGTDVTHGADVVTEWVYNDTIAFNVNDTWRLYIEDHYDASTDNLYIFGDEGFQFSGAFQYGESYMNVTGQTTYQFSEADGYLIHDLIHGVLARMGLGTDPFYSEFLGGLLTNAKQYDDDGCGWMYGIFKGLQIRGYTLVEKPFFISMKQIWDGINPILNLGLGYEVVDSVEVIRIEPKSHFIGSTKAINFSDVRQISSSYDHELIFKTIKTGYKKWQAEEASGLDDPQTKHTYATRMVNVGIEVAIESDFIAASYAIETTRRTTREKSSDYKFDNDTFIIALNTDDLSPDLYLPELDEPFSSVTNVLNSETRYNLLLTPARALLRWGAYLSGCLQSYLSSNFKFVSGEGNYDMTSDANIDILCPDRAVTINNLAESDDISPIGLGYYFLPILYDISLPMEKDDFDMIDRKEPIGISQTDTDFTEFHIKEMEYEILKGSAIIKAWPKVFFNITVPEQEISMLCEPPIVYVAGEEILSNPDFLTVLTPWSNEDNGGFTWNWSAGDKAHVSITAGVGHSDLLVQSFATQIAATYYVQMKVGNSGVVQSTLTIEAYKAGVLVDEILSIQHPASTGEATTWDYEVAIPGEFDTIKIKASYSPVGLRTFSVFYFSLKRRIVQ